MSLRSLPSIERLLQSEGGASLIDAFGRPLTVDALRNELAAARLLVRKGNPAPSTETLLAEARRNLGARLAPSISPVINATGVILHTNLGRAPLSPAACEAMLRVAGGYSTLEFDLSLGRRGDRSKHAEAKLLQLTGAEAALVVNNNAAAVLLALTGLARRKEVLIARSQLIEIGGGFRIPEVMQQSGARLVEVGTTNRTHLSDFETAIHERTGLIMRAHHSNFRITGFMTEPSLQSLVELGEQHQLSVFDDLGSGALLDTALFGLGHEPMVQESLQTRASLVAFSGDKLLGGPQAGILLGERRLVDRLRKHPLARAVRADKLCLAALEATLTHYLLDEAVQQIPVWRMIAAEAETLRRRASSWAAELGRGQVVPELSTVGGGSLPEETLPTWVLSLDPPHPGPFSERLRRANPPVIARIADNQVRFDPRTVLPEEEGRLLDAVRLALMGERDGHGPDTPRRKPKRAREDA
ncbi:MAG: L-seryl-tRNA(Sec) selenium transferase [Chloroflexi bacterium RBG_19FT_COMBO_62_14]|nr:MAG: L-seryl-tRNA(Sec) selenium transferase [Chloroflexi bacterium RBG_19FT_COMBO_62_14]